MQQPDILLFMSDQHAARYVGFDGGMVDTPNLDALAAEGTRFDAHYTSCPLCVPARMSFLSGALPTRIGVTNNSQTIGEMRPTFLFPLVEAGYETVLIGRMHFLGKDLRHGFIKRIGCDMTATCWQLPQEVNTREKGILAPTFAPFGALNVVGGGESPVIYYDREIIRLAKEYLAQPHEKPQFIVVGTMGPHSPYVADPELYLKYRKRNYLAETFNSSPDFIRDNPWLQARQRIGETEEKARKASAAYCALIEQTDGYIGELRAAFTDYTKNAGHHAVFGYTSDHGDMIGSYRMFGKQTFFEDSVRVPLIFAGDGIPKGLQIKTPTSIMDLGPTFCEMAGTYYEGEFVDGVSFLPLLQGTADEEARPVISQLIDTIGGKTEATNDTYAVMIREGQWKFVLYHKSLDTAALFDIKNDPLETTNAIGSNPDVAERLDSVARSVIRGTVAEQEHADRVQMTRWLRAVEAESGYRDIERWKDNPPSARGQLTAE